MARNIYDIHRFIDDIERKEQGVYHTPAQKDAALDASQKEIFRESYLIKDWVALDPFKVTNKPFTTNSTGILSFGTDYECFKDAFAGTIAKPIPIRKVSDEELPDAINSQLRPISPTKPIAVLSTNSGARGLNIYPQTTYTGFYTYYSLPATPKFAFSRNGRQIIYDANNSVQIQFTDTYVDRIISKALGFLGISMSEADIVNFSQYKEKTT